MAGRALRLGSSRQAGGRGSAHSRIQTGITISQVSIAWWSMLVGILSTVLDRRVLDCNRRS